MVSKARRGIQNYKSRYVFDMAMRFLLNKHNSKAVESYGDDYLAMMNEMGTIYYEIVARSTLMHVKADSTDIEAFLNSELPQAPMLHLAPGKDFNRHVRKLGMQPT